MNLFTVFLTLSTFSLVQSQTICDTYTTALFTVNNSTNQFSLITAVVDLAVMGDNSLGVPGILAPSAGLVPIFSGAGPTTNRNGVPVTINFLDAGTNQNILLVHLYQFFGALLGCTAVGFPAFGGNPDMTAAHRFMDIDEAENNYFISQVGAAAGALGVSSADVTTITTLLDTLFNTRCADPLTAADGVPSFMIGTFPSVCLADTCPLDPNGTCEDEEEGGIFARLFARIVGFFGGVFG